MKTSKNARAADLHLLNLYAVSSSDYLSFIQRTECKLNVFPITFSRIFIAKFGNLSPNPYFCTHFEGLSDRFEGAHSSVG